MKTFYIAAAFIALLSGSALAQGKQDFELVNKTGYEIKEIYVAPSKSDDWEEDTLGDETLEDGETWKLSFSGSSKTCLWDIKVVYEIDNSSARWSEIDLCKVSKVTIRWDKNSGVTRATFD